MNTSIQTCLFDHDDNEQSRKMDHIGPFTKPPLQTSGLFAGIGGIEAGLHRAGHQTNFLCEVNPGAQAVLKYHFEGVKVVGDVRSVRQIPETTELLAAGFPCQDLSQAGRTAGIMDGEQSSLVSEVFRLIKGSQNLRWLLLENVPFMLSLDRGEAMRVLVRSLENLGYRWAYRIVDTRSFGLPQRRRRVMMLASRTEDPRTVLLVDDADQYEERDYRGRACGFYWTEGTRGLGWAVDAVPTLKKGSTIGIASPPAVWMGHNGGSIVTPHIRDAERLQGFSVDWTLPAIDVAGQRKSSRWGYVGNAVSVPVAEWIGRRLRAPLPYDAQGDRPLGGSERWPSSAWGQGDGVVYRSDCSEWPLAEPMTPLSSFLEHEPRPLSKRATAGFLRRTRKGRLRFKPGFIEAIENHLRQMGGDPDNL